MEGSFPLTVTVPLLSWPIFRTALPSKKRTFPVGIGPVPTASTVAERLTIDPGAGLAGMHERATVGVSFTIIPEYLADCGTAVCESWLPFRTSAIDPRFRAPLGTQVPDDDADVFGVDAPGVDGWAGGPLICTDGGVAASWRLLSAESGGGGEFRRCMTDSIGDIRPSEPEIGW